MSEPTLTKPKARAMPAWKLKEYIDKQSIFLDAPYQRDIVWDKNKMSDLIDSMLNNYYIPPLVFALRTINGKMTRVCIDGKQRLTSVYKFMNNELPYIDRSVGTNTEYFFNKPNTNNPNLQAMQRAHGNSINYLCTEKVEHFISHEFVCVEYSDLSEDDEYEVFNRVQLGVAISTAEKLRANNSVVARRINKLANEYLKLEVALNEKGTAAVFQVIAQIVLVLQHGKDPVKFSPRNLNALINSNEDLSRSVIDKTKFILRKLAAMCLDKNCVVAFLTDPVTKNKNLWKRIELLCFCAYLSIADKNRTLVDLSQDCSDMRIAMAQNYRGRLYVSAETYRVTMLWAEKRASEIETRKRGRALSEREFLSDEEEDQLEYNSDEQSIAPTSDSLKRTRRSVPAIARRGKARR